jgi:hypothetical protein
LPSFLKIAFLDYLARRTELMIFDRLSRGVRRGRSGKPGGLRPHIEELEGRALLSAMTPTLVMDSATTRDSRSVTFEYDVQNADLGQSVTFGIYRSADNQFDASDVAVGSVTVTPPGQGTPTRDDRGQPAGAVGHHQLTVPLPQGLPLNPEHPYVLVVADPSHAASGVTENGNTASFRTYTIGVVTHGGIQPHSWRRGVPWELRMADSLRNEGYDTVIAYNWVPSSGDPGAAARQGPRVAQAVLRAASQFPANDPVDLHFIGHSEGAVVNSLAILQLSRDEPASLRAGYLDETLLDPHAANNHAPGGRQYSVSSGLLGTIARWAIHDYQGRAKDPLPVVPAHVNAAEVFFQHTPIADAKGSNHGEYNLWGQVPVRAAAGVPVKYYNLTGLGISHGGDYSVPDWYQVHVVPTLGTGSSFVNPGLLTGGLETFGNAGTSSQPTFGGQAAPGATVQLVAAAQGSRKPMVLGRTAADAAGNWSITPGLLPPGTDHLTARALAVADPAWPHVFVTPKVRIANGIIAVPRSRA